MSKLLRERSTLLWCVLLAVLVGGTFLPALHNGFINYDDPVYVYSNPHVTSGLTWANIQWAFSTFYLGFWHPLAWMSIQLDCELFGVDAGGHHFTSILLHTASTVLLFLVLRRMTGAPGRSAFVAALFGLHPLHVESVVWACERKDVLSTFFFMLTLLAYTQYAARMEARGLRMAEGQGSPPSAKQQAPGTQSSILHSPSSLWYILSLLCFTLGLMSKTMIVMLPVTLVLLDFWPLRRFHSEGQLDWKRAWTVLVEKAPFFGLALVFGILTIVAQKHIGALQTTTRFPLMHRVDNALLAYVQYLRQAFWPSGLALYYSYPRSFQAWRVLLAAAALLLVSVGALWGWRRRPYLAIGWLWYLLTLLPVSGIIQVGNLSRADRYTYIPLIGIFIAVAWGAVELATQAGWLKRSPATAPQLYPSVLPLTGVAVLVACLLVSHEQIGYWHDSERVYRHALEVTTDNEVAQNNLGTALVKRGKLDEATVHFREAVRLAPGYALYRGNLGAALFNKGMLDESIYQSKEAIRLKPDYAAAYRNVGAALGTKGQADEAIAYLEKAVQLDPQDAEGFYNLGYALARKGRFNDGIRCIQRSLQLRPGDKDAQMTLEAIMKAKALADSRRKAKTQP